MCNPSALDDEEQGQLQEKRMKHIKPSISQDSYKLNDPIWFTEDGCSEWKSGYVESKDEHPN